MEMEDQYNMADLRQLMNGAAATSTRSHFTPIPQHPTELFPAAHRATLSPPPHHHPHNHHHHHNPYELMMMAGRHHQVPNIMPRGLHDFRSDPPSGANNSTNNSASLTVTVAAANSAPSLSGGLEAETGGCLGGGDGGSGRWPRQETLTLLEIRSRLDYKFKEANQKGPLWDEVSRIMGEEHGYQRSGKKCREKFENLYKYYKKTKEGKAGRQDGKHYRFFRQLEALYGGESTTNAVIISSSLPETHFVGTNNNNNNNYHQTANNIQASHETTSYHEKHSESLSLSNYNSSEFGSSSSEDNNVSEESPEKTGRKRRGGRGWKSKIKEFIDAQMRKLMERQEEWLGKVMSALEHKERERMAREDEWRKQEAERIEREHKFWAKERDWIEARDAALMDALHKFTGGSSSTDVHDHHHHQVIHAPTNEDGSEILNINTAKGELLSINYHQMRKYNSKEEDHDLFSKKRKENCTSTTPTTTTSSCYFQNNEACSSLYSQGGGYNCGAEMSNEQAAGNDGGASDHSPCDNANVGAGNIAVVDDHHNSCFPFLMTEGDQNLWENYGLKITKGSQNH